MEALLFLLRIYFFCFSYKTGNLKKIFGLYLCAGRFLLKGSMEKQVFILQEFLKHASSYLKKKKRSKLVELEVPLLLSLPSQPFF